jgi:hypothetical protein
LVASLMLVFLEWRQEDQPGGVQGHGQHEGGVVQGHGQHEGGVEHQLCDKHIGFFWTIIFI